MTGGKKAEEQLLRMVIHEPAKAQLTLLRMAYRAHKLGLITAADARMFGAQV